MKTFFNKLHYSKNNALSLLILPVSFFYSLAVCLRNFLYEVKFLKSTKLPAFVISVGNITTGGTGKTPITCEIANYYTSQNKKVAIISRGYGGKLDNKNSNIISNGEKVFYNAEEAGDEPYWLAKNCPKTIVITCKNRIKSGQFAIKEFNAEVLILDDGFQHRKLQRDLDIVLIDSNKLFGNGFLLPAGPLREHISELRRAHKVIMTDKAQKACVCELTGEKISEVKTAMAFSGIAQPDSFFNLLTAQNINLVSKKIFPDHYLYTKEDLQNLATEAQNAGAEALITTEKDMVKIEPFINEIEAKVPIYVLKLKANLDVQKLLGELSL